MSKKDKLDILIEIEGYDDSLEFMEEIGHDSVIPGICVNEDCDYTCGVEPDCRNGWCEECNTDTVQSALVLLDII